MKSVGEQLKLARLHKHWTPQAAAKATKIKVEQLIDLENDAYTKFASPSYARGFVRIYARNLGLDERKILSQLDGKLGEEDEEGIFVSAPAVEYIPEQVEVTAPVRAGRIGQMIIYAFGVFFAFIVVLMLLRFYQAGVVNKPGATEVTAKETRETVAAAPAHSAEKEAPKAVAVDPAAVKAAPTVASATTPKPNDAEQNSAKALPATPVSTLHQLTLQTEKKSSWVRVNLVENDHEKQLFEGVIEAGQSKNFEGDKFNLKIATPSVVDVIFDGVNYGPYSDGDSPESFTLPNVAQSD